MNEYRAVPDPYGTGKYINPEGTVMDWIFDANIEAFDSCEDVTTKTQRNTGTTRENDPLHDEKGNSLKCPKCEFVGADYQRTRAHYKTHDTDIIVKTFLTNQCPVCDKTFTDTMCARQHGKTLQKNKKMPRSSPNWFKQVWTQHC